MIELPLIFASGLFGTSHCMGMCGPFAIVIGAGAKTKRDSLWRQCLYGIGRISTYSALGSLAGFAGLRFAAMGETMINVQATLAFLAGGFLIYQGLSSAGVIRKHHVRGEFTSCAAAPVFQTFLTSKKRTDVFLAGVFTGFLPCGLLYGILLLAAETRHVGWGMLVMAVFGTGTLPLMTLIGMGGSMLGMNARKKLLTIAAWCVVLAGVISIARGFRQIGVTTFDEAIENCPMCETNADAAR